MTSALALSSDYTALPQRCGVSRLVLQEFRSYSDLNLSIKPESVVLIGDNGAGKTNILEALSFLSPGRGLRNAKLSHVGNVQASPQKPWAVAIDLSLEEGTATLGTGLTFTANGSEKRLLKINGAPAKSQATLTDWLSVVWVTPQMDRLFLEATSARRKFVDRLVYALDFTHAERIHRYDHHLRERSLLLREGRGDPSWLSALEENLSADGVSICVARRHLIESITQSQEKDLSYPFPRFKAEMVGDLELWLDTLPALAVEEKIRDHLARSRQSDAQTGGACVGPHRSDLRTHHLGNNMPAEFCSTGQQKILLLALILAFIKVRSQQQSTCGLLLLDDVMEHLDHYHRTVLFQEIHSSGISNHTLQTWMTGTDPKIFQDFLSHAQGIMVGNSTLTKRI